MKKQLREELGPVTPQGKMSITLDVEFSTSEQGDLVIYAPSVELPKFDEPFFTREFIEFCHLHKVPEEVLDSVVEGFYEKWSERTIVDYLVGQIKK